MKKEAPGRRSALEVLRESIADVPRVSLRDVEDPSAAPATRAAAVLSANHGETPAEIGRYRVAGEIARGGVGAVLKARDPDLGRDVAVKVLLEAHAGDPAIVRRFVEEAQIASQMQHPGIVPLHSVGTVADGRPYFTMKLVKGQTLAVILDDRRDTTEDRLRFLGMFEQVCRTLAYAHSRGVVHRDLKPSNIMVGAFGEVLVMDWGLAKVFAADGSVHEETARTSQVRTLRVERAGSESLAGSVLGTPAYMSPEQARGELERVDARSDVFGLGAILCEILTGQPPYAGRSAEVVVGHARNGDLDEAFERLDGCGAGPDLVDLAKRCLAVEPRDRPADADPVACAVRRHLDSLEERARRSAIAAAGARTRFREDRRARRLAVVLSVAVALVVLAAGAGLFRVENDRRNRTTEASRSAREALVEASRLVGAARVAATEDLAPWDDALRAVARAKATLGPDVDRPLADEVSRLAEHVDGEVREARRAAARSVGNRRLVERLAAIRATGANRSRDRLGLAYREAFRGFGVDIEGLPEDRAASRIRGSGVEVEIARALDHWAWWKKERYGRSSEGWRKLLRLASAVDPDPWRGRLRAAGEMDDLSELRRLASETERSPASAFTLELLARSLSDAGDASGAVMVLLRGWEAYPDDFWINAMLGASSGIESTGPFLTSALAVEPSAPWIRQQLGWFHLERGDGSTAIRWFEDAVRLGDDPAEARIGLGSAFVATGRLARAIDIFREAIEIQPAHSILHNHLGVALDRTADRRGALRAYQEAIRRGASPAAFDNMGLCLWNLGKPAEAAAAWQAALRLAPDGIHAARLHDWIADRLLRLGDHEGAVFHYREASRLDPRRISAWSNLGQALAERGQAVEALDALTKAIQISPSSPCEVLRPLLERLGGRPPADQRFEQVIDRFLDVVDRILTSEVDHEPTLRICYLEALELKLGATAPRAALDRMDDEIGPEDLRSPQVFVLLGRVRHRAGLEREAIAALETARELGADNDVVDELLREYRAKLLPDLATLDSIDAALERLEPVIPDGARWRLLRGTREPSPGLEWTGLDYDDRDWEEGKAGFGFGDDDDRTVLDDMRERYTTVYIRRTFEVPDIESLDRAVLRVMSDDGFVAYLNGTEVGRLRAGDPGQRLDCRATASASHDADEADILGIPTELIRQGRNVMAIQGLNRSLGTSSDFSLAPELRASFAGSPEEERDRFATFRSAASGPDAQARLAYLEGRILQRAKRPAEALQWFEGMVSAGTSEPTSWMRIVECLRSLGRGDEIPGRLEVAFRLGLRATSRLLEAWLRAAGESGWPWRRIVAAWPREAAPHQRVLSAIAETLRGPLRYTTTQPQGEWEARVFDDSSWSDGAEPPTALPPSTMIDGREVRSFEDLWVRAAFETETSQGYNSLLRVTLSLRALHDGALDVHLNGRRIYRAENGTAGRYRSIPLDDPTILQDGVNVLAVHRHGSTGQARLELALVEEIEPVR